jgi:hypothetical protein
MIWEWQLSNEHESEFAERLVDYFSKKLATSIAKPCA